MNERLGRHPNLVAWAVLAVGMLVMLAWSARDQPLAPGQWLWLAAATVALAGLCAWIISGEADAPENEDAGAPENEDAGAPENVDAGAP